MKTRQTKNRRDLTLNENFFYSGMTTLFLMVILYTLFSLTGVDRGVLLLVSFPLWLIYWLLIFYFSEKKSQEKVSKI